MVFLPIVERELRVAARKPSTFWVRVVGVLMALFIGAGFLILSSIGPMGRASPAMGRVLFDVLTWLCLAAALTAGLFFTSDCLSQEKREGTLGFLFLTDLKGHDVVLGKLLATSLRSFCVLLGVFPILAITFLMGGVTGGEFWRTCLALLNGLFVSLAAGLWVSTISRSSQKAMGATLLMLVLLAGAGPAADLVLAKTRQVPFDPMLTFSSPVFLFLSGSHQVTQRFFWPAALTNHLLTWAFLGAAFLILPRTWQDKARSGSSATTSVRRGRSRRRGSARGRQPVPETNPVGWLLGCYGWRSTLLWVIALLLLAALVGVFSLPDRWMVWQAWPYLTGLITLGLYLAISSEAARFFVEARRSGFMELLLATPVRPPRIVAGQWSAALRRFAPPLAVFLLAGAVGSTLVQQKTWGRIAAVAANAPTAVATNAPAPVSVTATNRTSGAVTNVSSSRPPAATSTRSSPAAFESPGLAISLAMAAAGMLMTAANWVALIWFGMWMGLTSKNLGLATLKTLLFVQVIPWFVVSFAGGLIAMLVLMPIMITRASSGPMSITMTWFPLLTTAVTLILALAKDIGFCVFARRRLHSRFLERAAQQDAPAASIAPAPPKLKAEPAAADSTNDAQQASSPS